MVNQISWCWAAEWNHRIINIGDRPLASTTMKWCPSWADSTTRGSLIMRDLAWVHQPFWTRTSLWSLDPARCRRQAFGPLCKDLWAIPIRSSKTWSDYPNLAAKRLPSPLEENATTWESWNISMNSWRRSVPASAIVDPLMGASCNTKVMICILDQHFHDNRKKMSIFPKESLASNFLDALWEWSGSGIACMILQVERVLQVSGLCARRAGHGGSMEKGWRKPVLVDLCSQTMLLDLKIAINDNQWSQVNSIRCADIEDSHDKESQSLTTTPSLPRSSPLTSIPNHQTNRTS